MRKNIKITKIVTIILIAICMLLIAPKQVNAATKSLTFNCYGVPFTINGVGDYDEYQLAYDICNADKISDINSKWKAGVSMTYPDDHKLLNVYENDGYYIMRWRCFRRR